MKRLNLLSSTVASFLLSLSLTNLALADDNIPSLESVPLVYNASTRTFRAEKVYYNESQIVYPLVGERVSSKFGNRNHPIYKSRKHHKGIDLAAPRGASVRAVRDGQVVFSDPYKGYGNLIVLLHKNGETSHYGHLNEIQVLPGSFVKAGEIIGTVGTSGNVTGPHLHFEVRQEGQAIDPSSVMPGLTSKAQG